MMATKSIPKTTTGNKYISSDTAATVEVMNARGELTIKIIIFVIVGIAIIVLLIIAGTISYLESSKVSGGSPEKIWAIIGPIVSGFVSALVGYVIGRKDKS